MRVVADSHALIFYLFLPDRLTQRALGALGEAEDSGGVVVSAATLGDLWYASHKSGPKALAPGAYESLRRTVLDPATNFEVAGIMAETMEHFDRVPSPSWQIPSTHSSWPRLLSCAFRWSQPTEPCPLRGWPRFSGNCWEVLAVAALHYRPKRRSKSACVTRLRRKVAFPPSGLKGFCAMRGTLARPNDLQLWTLRALLTAGAARAMPEA